MDEESFLRADVQYWTERVRRLQALVDKAKKAKAEAKVALKVKKAGR